ncbi:MAG: acyltransferase family protein [Clostridiaceae bacterium]
MIKPYQSFRFFAIVAVFLSHLGYLIYTPYKSTYNRYFIDGYFGVTFFLILSGIVISISYYNKVNDINIKTMVGFLAKRIRRIYPLHIITFIITLFVIKNEIMLYPEQPYLKGFLNLTLLHSFFPEPAIYFSYNTISWYLSTIAFCYLVTPLLFKGVKYIKGREINLWCLIITIFVFQFVYVNVFKSAPKSHWLIYISPFFRMLDYFVGIILGVIIKDSKEKKLSQATFWEGISILFFLLAYYYFPFINRAYRYGVYYMPFIIFIVYVFAFQGGLISRILSNRVFMYLGEISFEFYMIHRLILTTISKNIGVERPIYTATTSFIYALLSAVLLNVLITNRRKYIKMIRKT